MTIFGRSEAQTITIFMNNNRIEFKIRQKNRYLHSKEHVLADDLSKAMLEPKRFAAYLGITKVYYEQDLRALARRVSEKRDLDPKARGKYFFACLKRLEKKREVRPSEKKKKRKASFRNR